MITCSDRDKVFAYFQRVLGLHWSDDFRGVLYVPDEFAHRIAQPEHVSVAVGYDAFVGRTCCIHTVITRPEAVTRQMVRDAFLFPFVRCECQALIGLVDSKNATAYDMDTRLGFREVHRIPNGGPEGDLIVLQMLRSECRWIRHALH